MFTTKSADSNSSNRERRRTLEVVHHPNHTSQKVGATTRGRPDASSLLSNGQKPRSAPHTLVQPTITRYFPHRQSLHHLGFHRKRRVSSRDLELQPLEVAREVQLQRDRLKMILFGKQGHDHDTPIPTAAYLNHLEDQIHTLGNDLVDALLNILHYDTPAPDDGYLSILADIAEIVKRDQRQDKSIDNILQQYLETHGVAEDALVAEKKPSSSQEVGVFPVPLSRCCVGMHKSQRVDAARRPIIRLLNSFGQILPEIGKAENQSSSLLYVSSLNFNALRLFGRVNIQWTNSMCAHLRFHPTTRTLHIFQFPSVCAMYLNVGDDESIFHSVLAECFHDSDSSSSLHRQYLREMLLSYRLIFGQGRSSRKLFMVSERPRFKSRKMFDSLLVDLCGRKNGKSINSLGPSLWPETCLDFDRKLREQDVYDVNLDFRFLGARLLNLQAFNLRQEPSRIRDLWRDRRNVLQWYTFWAVILVGGLTVLLGILQCVITAAQLYFAIKT